MSGTLADAARSVLLTADPARKADRARAVAAAWRAGDLAPPGRIGPS